MNTESVKKWFEVRLIHDCVTCSLNPWRIRYFNTRETYINT